jgi:hypothetical protein
MPSRTSASKATPRSFTTASEVASIVLPDVVSA